MEIPIGYTYKDGGYWYEDGSGPYGYDGTSMFLLFGSVRLLGQSGVPQTVTAGSVAEEVLAQVILPAGILGLNGALRLRTLWTGSNTANVKTLRYRLGVTALGGSAWFANVNALLTPQITANLEQNIYNRGVANSQVSYSIMNGNITPSTGSAVVTFAEDTSQELIVAITGQKATGADVLTLEAWSLEVRAP